MKNLSAFFALYSVFCVLPGCSKGPPGAKVSIKGRVLEVDWIRSDPARTTVPIDHAALGGDRGFLVGYDDDQYLYHYSKGSDGGYDVAWIGRNGQIVELGALDANSDEGVTSTAEAQYALFARPGWFQSAGIGKGDAIDLGSGITGNP